MRYIVTIIFFHFTVSSIAQNFNQELIDSLKQVIATTDKDSLRVDSYVKICGEFYFYDNDSILHYASKIAELADIKNNKDYLAISDTEIGTAFWEKAQYDKAIFHYTRALEYLKSDVGYRDDVIIADISYNLGLCYTDIGNYDKALVMLNEAIDYFDSTKNYQWKAHASNAIGDIYIELKNFDKAIRNYRTALTTLPGEFAGAFDQGLFYGNLANGLLKIGALDSSEYFVQKSIEIYADEEMSWGMAFSYGILSKIARVKQDYKAAKAYGQSSLQYSTEQGSPAEMAEAYLLIGEAALLNEEINYALNNVSRGDSISAVNNLPMITMKAKELLASIHEKLGDSKASYTHFKAYTELKDSLFSLDKIEELNKVNLKYVTATRDVEIANQDLKIAKQKITRNYLLGGIGAISLLSMFFLYRSRLKQKINLTEIQLKEEKIQNLEQRQKLLAVDYIMKGQEEERRRVAKELHDGLGGMLSTAKQQLRTLGKSLEQTDSEVYKQAEDLLGSAHAEVRKIAHNMMPDALTNLGLQSAVEDIATQVNLTKQLKVKTLFSLEPNKLSKDQELVVYRVVQESINNAFNHANAEELMIQIIDQGEALHLTIEDDGDGFDINSGTLAKGLGLKSMESRVKYLNGVIEIASKVGEGTTIDVTIPFEK